MSSDAGGKQRPVIDHRQVFRMLNEFMQLSMEYTARVQSNYDKENEIWKENTYLSIPNY